MDWSELKTSDILGFTVVAAVITTTGTLIGLFLKEFLFARSFERWKAKRSAEQVYRKYRDPLVLAALELLNRFGQLCDGDPADFRDSQILKSVPQRATLVSGETVEIRAESSDPPGKTRFSAETPLLPALKRVDSRSCPLEELFRPVAPGAGCSERPPQSAVPPARHLGEALQRPKQGSGPVVSPRRPGLRNDST